MGPFRMGDLAGNDIGWAIRKRRYQEKPDMKYSKTADLLCDTDRSVAMAYGAAESADQERATRVTVIIGPDGRVLKAWAVDNAEAHPAEALAHID